MTVEEREQRDRELIGTTMNVHAAAGIIAEHSTFVPLSIISHAEQARRAVRAAIARTHPDRHNGDRSAYDVVETAKRVLTAHHGVQL